MKYELRSLHQRFIDLSNQSDTYEARVTFAFCADEIESILTRAEAVADRSTHHVHRRDESLPCYCEAETDHPIGEEC